MFGVRGSWIRVFLLLGFCGLTVWARPSKAGPPFISVEQDYEVESFTFPTGDSNSYFLKLETIGATDTSLKVSEGTRISLIGIQAQAGAAWFPPFRGKFPGGHGLETTMKWVMSVGGQEVAKGGVSEPGYPTEAEWYDWFPDEVDYPYSGQFLTNKKLRIWDSIYFKSETFEEGSGRLSVHLSGTTYVWRNHWTPDSDWKQNMPVEWKRFEDLDRNGPNIVSGPPYDVVKSPSGDSYTFPHQAIWTVNLLGENLTTLPMGGNVQAYENPTLVTVGPNVQVAPLATATLRSDTHMHTGTHPPAIVQVLPDFAPISTEVVHRVWDLAKNQGKEYKRLVTLNPTTLFCKAVGVPDSTGAQAVPNPTNESTPGGVVPRRDVETPGGRILPEPPGSDPKPISGDVSVTIHSVLLGNPDVELDAAPDGNDLWSCLNCVQSGDEVILDYEFRDVFGRSYGDTIHLSVPDSLDLAAPQTLQARRPVLHLQGIQIDADQYLTVDVRVLDLAGGAFGDLRTLQGMGVYDFNGWGSGYTDANGEFLYSLPHSAQLQLYIYDLSGRYKYLPLPPTPPVESMLTFRQVAPGEWRDDRLILWMTPSFTSGRLQVGSGRIDDASIPSIRVSHVGAVSDLAPAELVDAFWGTVGGPLLIPAAVRAWGETPDPGLGYVPLLFALDRFSDGSVSESQFQAALQEIIDTGVARLQVTTSGFQTLVLDIPLDFHQTTGVSTDPEPKILSLRAMPNPFGSSTTLSFTLSRNERVEVEIIGVDGRRVATLIAGKRPAGPVTLMWDGRDDRGVRVAAGAYLARLRTEEGDKTQKLILVR